MRLPILRNNAELVQVEIDERTVFTQKLMGEHKIVADFIHDSPLPAHLGDYIEHRGEKFYINTPPEVEKINNFTYRYVIAFEGEIYRLYSKIFMDEGQADFSYHGAPEDFLLLILTNINSIDAGWAIEQVDDATAQTLTFSNDSCRTALTKVAEAFQLEYRLVNKNIYLERSVGFDTTLQFEYGPHKGLYHLQRNKIEDKNVVTRVYGFGARKNLSYDYRDGSPRLVFEERKLEKNVDLYGVREGSVTFDEIYPNRTGTVSTIDPEDPHLIYDSSLNFDLSSHLLEGVTAKIVFKTGALSGYEFEIKSYRHSDRRIRFNPFVEENGYTLPNNINFPEVGDKYTLVDIKMPQVYITEAEGKLKERTLQYLEENSSPRVMYDLEIDEKYIRERGIELKVADLVRVLDDKLGINNKIRVAEVSYPIVNPDAVTAVISDTIPYTIEEKLISGNVDNNKEIREVDRERVELARRSALRFRELQSLITDPDGYFDPVNLKPGSIETLMLSVGARSQNFGLIGVTIEANFEGVPSKMKISGGQLAHYTIEIEGLGYVWEMDPRIFTGLDPNKHYYVYARCSATALKGTWEVSETPKAVDAEEGYYLFNLGILYSVKDGRRDFDFTNGMTYINGDTITTGRIKSLDGLNYFDLSAGKFKLGNEESSLDYNVTEKGRLTLKGVLVSSLILADDAAIERLSVRSLRTRDEGRRLEITESGNNLILYDSEGREIVRVDDDIDSDNAGNPLGGIRTTNPENRRASYVSGNGVFSNASGTMFFSATTGRSSNASVVGLLSEVKPGISAGIAGINATGNNNGYGGYIYGGLLVEGGRGLELKSAMHINTRTLGNSSSGTLKDDDHFLSCYNTQTIMLYLPANPKKGRVIRIRRHNEAAVGVRGSNGIKIVKAVPEDLVWVGKGRGDTGEFIFDGGYWFYSVLLR